MPSNKEACGQGHPYTEENTRWIGTVRQCRQCDKNRAQAKRDKARGNRPKFERPLAKSCFRGHALEGDNLYYYDTAHGRQRRCRACDVIRNQERIAGDLTVQPTKDFCAKGHPMEGENLGVRSNGFSLCRACANEATKKYQRQNREVHLERKRGGNLRCQAVEDEAIKAVMLIAFTQPDDDQMIYELRMILGMEGS